MPSETEFLKLVADYDELARGVAAEGANGLDIDRVAAMVAGAGIIGCFAWLFDLASKQREQEAWRKIVNQEMRELKVESTATHDAVIVLQTDVSHLTDDVGEIKLDQKSILERLAELISRP
jgi:uncharacterized protein with ATP-grasp and redox domains